MNLSSADFGGSEPMLQQVAPNVWGIVYRIKMRSLFNSTSNLENLLLSHKRCRGATRGEFNYGSNAPLRSWGGSAAKGGFPHSRFASRQVRKQVLHTDPCATRALHQDKKFYSLHHQGDKFQSLISFFINSIKN